MCDEKKNKTEQPLIKGKIDEKLYNEKPLNEGYQPTDKLDTTNPPIDKGDDKTE